MRMYSTLAYHLCWTKLVLNSALTKGGSGWANPLEKVVRESGNLESPLASLGTAAEDKAMTRESENFMLVFWRINSLLCSGAVFVSLRVGRGWSD